MDKVAKLEKIAEEIENCKICKKDKSGKAVPGEGNPNTDIVFIGEAPGKQEAKIGRRGNSIKIRYQSRTIASFKTAKNYRSQNYSSFR